MSPDQTAHDSRLLLITDMKTNQVVVESFLKGTCYEIDLAEDPTEAARRFASRPYYLVLLDTDMLFINSHAIAQEIREYESNQGLRPTPIIAMTGRTFRSGNEVGHMLKLPKPLTKSTLLGALQVMAQLVLTSSIR